MKRHLRRVDFRSILGVGFDSNLCEFLYIFMRRYELCTRKKRRLPSARCVTEWFSALAAYNVRGTYAADLGKPGTVPGEPDD